MSTSSVIAYTWAAPEAVPPRWADLLSQAERAELCQGRSAADGQLRLAARALLRGLLLRVGAQFGGAPLRRLASGALALQGEAKLEVNVSHTRGLAAAAISTLGAVGIDVECCDAALDHDAVAARFFHADECAELSRLAPSRRRQAFFALWTGKEAVAKALGLGLERDLPMKHFALHPASSHGWSVQGVSGVHAAYPLPAPPGYSAALALAGGSGAQHGIPALFVEARHG